MPTLTEKAADIIAYLDKNAKTPTPTGLPTVAELLTQSRAQHAIYRRSLRHRANGVTVDGNVEAATEAVSTSARLRAQAEILDPQHKDSAWADDLAAKFPHEALVEFYEQEVKYYVPPIVTKPPDEPPKDPKPVDEVATEHGHAAQDNKPKARKAKPRAVRPDAGR